MFTYLRPFLESVTNVEVTPWSLLLLVVGVAGLIGTSLVGRLLIARLSSVLIITPLCMALIAVPLVAFGRDVWVTAPLLGVWGSIATPLPSPR